ncbi:MAG: hypothetical protein IJV80_05485 [Clostridia bacterium]|nr:hypothetical protein [Clostridia bacterium]
MEIYFRKTNENGYEYSLEEFECGKEQETLSFTIPDFYSDEEGEELCEKMLEEYSRGVPFADSLKQELEEKNRFFANLLQAESFTCKNARIKSVCVNVYLVNRGNFNDERLIESTSINLKELIGKPLAWFNAYLGKNKGEPVYLAPVYAEKGQLYFLKESAGKREVKKVMNFELTFTDDYNESYIIAACAHGSCSD